jgi:hypothetical protein
MASAMTGEKIKAKDGGAVAAEMDVWVVWCELTLEDNTPFMKSPVKNGKEFTQQGRIKYRYDCFPFAMFDLTQDVPNFNLPPDPPAPGGIHLWLNLPLSGGAEIRFDATRQVRVVRRSSDAVLLSSELAWAPDIPSYPATIAEGNDDVSGNFLPYEGPSGTQGRMRDADNPIYTMKDSDSPATATFLMNAQFRQYARVQIKGIWYQCSELKLSDIKIKFRKTAGIWANDGSSFVIGNGPFPPQ